MSYDTFWRTPPPQSQTRTVPMLIDAPHLRHFTDGGVAGHGDELLALRGLLLLERGDERPERLLAQHVLGQWELQPLPVIGWRHGRDGATQNLCSDRLQRLQMGFAKVVQCRQHFCFGAA